MEKEILPARAIKPGDILRDELEAREWSQADLASILGRPIQVVNEILQGRKAITPETAIGLATALGTSPEFWLNLESAYRLHIARDLEQNETIKQKAEVYSLGPIKEMKKRGWIKDTANPEELQVELQSFYRVGSLAEIPKFEARFRFSASHVPDSPSLWAWLARARNLAGQKKVARFSSTVFAEEIPQLPRRSASEEDTASLPQILGKLGIRLVFVPHLPRTYTDGAAFWLDDDSPAVALSLRYNRVDNFWFTLMHELAHLTGDKKSRKDYLDNNLDPSATEGEEGRANRQAARWLISQEALDQFVSEKGPRFTVRAIRDFAKSQGVHPAIVVGRLHHDGPLHYSRHRSMLGKVRHLFLP